MKHVVLAVALACLFSGFAQVHAQDSGEKTYVPRSERNSDSTFTFRGSSKGLVIIDHETGEVTRYTTKRQKALHRMSPEAEESARTAWENRQEAAAEAIEAARQAEAEAEAEEASNNSGSDNGAGDAGAPAAAAGDGESNGDSEDAN